jgi:hypothetical protein
VPGNRITDLQMIKYKQLRGEHTPGGGCDQDRYQREQRAAYRRAYGVALAAELADAARPAGRSVGERSHAPSRECAGAARPPAFRSPALPAVTMTGSSPTLQRVYGQAFRWMGMDYVLAVRGELVYVDFAVLQYELYAIALLQHANIS